jgi:hypothetical protein
VLGKPIVPAEPRDESLFARYDLFLFDTCEICSATWCRVHVGRFVNPAIRISALNFAEQYGQRDSRRTVLALVVNITRFPLFGTVRESIFDVTQSLWLSCDREFSISQNMQQDGSKSRGSGWRRDEIQCTSGLITSTNVRVPIISTSFSDEQELCMIQIIIAQNCEGGDSLESNNNINILLCKAYSQAYLR